MVGLFEGLALGVRDGLALGLRDCVALWEGVALPDGLPNVRGMADRTCPAPAAQGELSELA